MVSNFSVFGSCTSRNIFNTNINPNYKNYFKINRSIESVTLLSLMSEPIDFDDNLIDTGNKFSDLCIKEDLSKDFLNFLKSESIDYLIIDTYFDANEGSILLNNGSYISDSIHLPKSSLYNSLDIHKKISISNNFDEYLDLWKESCNLFFKFLNKESPNINVILNCSRNVSKYFEDFQIKEEEKFTFNLKYNDYRNIFDKYILEHFDVEGLSFNDNTLLDKNHIFGFSPAHYFSDYYSEKNYQLNEIIYRNNFKEIKRKSIINSFSNCDNRFNAIDYHDFKFNKLHEFLIKYNTARIDIFNEGSINNSIDILNANDSMNISFPPWFKNDLGNGVVIQSDESCLFLEIKCIGEGLLDMSLRGIDIRDNLGKRFPIYIDFNSFKINNVEYILDNKLVCHDNPFHIKKRVTDGEIIKIYTEWLPFNSSSIYEN